jgi:hypothetical protein
MKGLENSVLLFQKMSIVSSLDGCAVLDPIWGI